MLMKAFAYEVRAEPDTVLRSLGSAIAPETSSNLFYVDNVDTELVGLTDRPGRLSVRRRRDLFSGFSGFLRLDLVVTKADSGSRVVGRYRLGSLALMFRSISVVFLRSLRRGAYDADGLTGNRVRCRRDHCGHLPSHTSPTGVRRVRGSTRLTCRSGKGVTQGGAVLSRLLNGTVTRARSRRAVRVSRGPGCR